MEHIITISAAEAGERLDKALSRAAEGLSRSRVQALLAEGRVTEIGGGQSLAVTDASLKVREGQVFRIGIPPVVPSVIQGEEIPLAILHEDADLLILNKPPGLTVHPAPGHREGTLVNALIAHCGESLSGIGGVARPGIVHRIDKDTSGLLAVAKSDAAHAALSLQLSERSLKRTYLALVWSAPVPVSGSIEGNIGRSPANRQKMALLAEGGKPAVTHYRTLKRYVANGVAFAALVECNLETGRTHQIRVHLSYKGHALIGDPLYGGHQSTKIARLRKILPEEVVRLLSGFKRQALHATRLGLVHPVTQKLMQWEAPPPPDMQELLAALEPFVVG